MSIVSNSGISNPGFDSKLDMSMIEMMTLADMPKQLKSLLFLSLILKSMMEGSFTLKEKTLEQLPSTAALVKGIEKNLSHFQNKTELFFRHPVHRQQNQMWNKLQEMTIDLTRETKVLSKYLALNENTKNSEKLFLNPQKHTVEKNFSHSEKTLEQSTVRQNIQPLKEILRLLEQKSHDFAKQARITVNMMQGKDSPKELLQTFTHRLEKLQEMMLSFIEEMEKELEKADRQLIQFKKEVQDLKKDLSLVVSKNSEKNAPQPFKIFENTSNQLEKLLRQFPEVKEKWLQKAEKQGFASSKEMVSETKPLNYSMSWILSNTLSRELQIQSQKYYEKEFLQGKLIDLISKNDSSKSSQINNDTKLPLSILVPYFEQLKMEKHRRKKAFSKEGSEDDDSENKKDKDDKDLSYG